MNFMLFEEFTSSTDCRTETGVTVGLIDSLISIARVLKLRIDTDDKEVKEALKDLRADEDLKKILQNDSSLSENKASSISDLNKDQKPMVIGIAEILRSVKDVKNRSEIANIQIKKFKLEKINFDYKEFLKLCNL